MKNVHTKRSFAFSAHIQRVFSIMRCDTEFPRLWIVSSNLQSGLTPTLLCSIYHLVKHSLILQNIKWDILFNLKLLEHLVPCDSTGTQAEYLEDL